MNTPTNNQGPLSEGDPNVENYGANNDVGSFEGADNGQVPLAWPAHQPFPGYPPRPPGHTQGGPPLRDQRKSRALGDNIQGNQAGQIATWDSPECLDGESLVAVLKAYAFAEGAVAGVDIQTASNPFAGAASTVVPDGLLQSLEVLAVFQWGNDGVTKQVVLNLPAGQIIKIPFVGSYARAFAKLTAKYYPRVQGANLTFQSGTETYYYLNADPDLANAIFNSAQSPLLDPTVGYSGGSDPTVPTVPIHVDGIICRGSASISTGGTADRSARAVRRFYGSMPAAVAAYPTGGAVVFCPIAFGASSVMLQANPTAFQNPFTDPASGTSSPLEFAQLDAAGNVIGAFTANEFVPLEANCQQVIVYNTAANGVENPFALLYDLGL